MEEKKQVGKYKSIGKPLSGKELEDHKKSFTDMEDCINKLYGEKKNERKS